MVAPGTTPEVDAHRASGIPVGRAVPGGRQSAVGAGGVAVEFALPVHFPDLQPGAVCLHPTGQRKPVAIDFRVADAGAPWCYRIAAGHVHFALIFLAAWVVTRVSTEFFAHVETPPAGTGVLNAHTAPATRRIVNASLWLFAVAMAYPYLPGAHTEAFKGMSVILGLMVSIGASGLIGQFASGVMLVYTHALLVGEYVRIQDCEGTVTELGLFVTRLRTGLGEEIALPNALVLANVTRNFRGWRGARVLFSTPRSRSATTRPGARCMRCCWKPPDKCPRS